MNRSWKAISLGVGLLLLAIFLLNAGCSSSGKTMFRFMNAVPDQFSGLNVLLNPTTDTSPTFSNVGYATATGYQAAPSGSQTIEIEPTGTATVLYSKPITISSGTDTTLIAANFTPNLTVYTFTDNNTTPATNDFNLRIINVSPGLGPADVYVGQTSTPPLDIENISPTISGIGFGSASNYLAKAAGSWEIVVTAATSKIPVADTGLLTFSVGQVRTFVILNSQGGGETYALLSDLN